MGAMRGLVLIVVLVAVGVALLSWWRSRQAADEAKANPKPVVDPLRRDARGIDPRKIKVGDVVAHEGRDFLVRGTLAMDEDGYAWQEHHLDDTTIRRWLSVEDDEELEIVLWQSVDAPDLQPGPTDLTYEGTAFRRQEQGRASFTASGSTGTAPSGTVEYADYSAGDHRLSFERFGSGGDWEVGLGRTVNERELDIYPSTP